MGTALQQLSLFKISHGCKMMQLQYICAKLELNQAAQRFSANISTNVPLRACHACIYIYTHIHIHINSTRYINRSRYTHTSLHMSDLCKIPKDLFTQIFDVFFPGFGSTSFKASNSERNKAWPWPNFSSERTEGEAAKPKSFFLQRWTDLTRLRDSDHWYQ